MQFLDTLAKMTNVRCLKCLPCNQIVTVKTAIGHADYQEFAFPCPRCGVELRYGMTIDQKTADIRYTKIVNADWLEGLFPVPFVVKNDSETLIYKNLPDQISPFIATSFDPIDPKRFHADRELRFGFIERHWHVLQNCRIYYKNADCKRFHQQMEILNPKFTSTGPAMNREKLFTYYRNFAKPFTPATDQSREFLAERLGRAWTASPERCYELRLWLHDGWHELLENQFFAIKEQWVTIFHMISPLYMSLYWDSSKHNLDEYSLAQKRFVDLKPFYIDVFESLARISVIAVGIEGILRNGELTYSTRKGDRPLEDFKKTDNGSKWDLLQKMPVADSFAELGSSRLRNGIGHNAAHYTVKTDSIEYRNESKNGPSVTGEISYTQFCAKLISLYRQWEVASVYIWWLCAFDIENVRQVDAADAN